MRIREKEVGKRRVRGGEKKGRKNK